MILQFDVVLIRFLLRANPTIILKPDPKIFIQIKRNPT